MEHATGATGTQFASPGRKGKGRPNSPEPLCVFFTCSIVVSQRPWSAKMIWWSRSPWKIQSVFHSLRNSMRTTSIQILCRCFLIEDGNAVVVEAAEQDYSLQPTAAAKELTVFGRPDDGIVCASLASLSSSIHLRVMVECAAFHWITRAYWAQWFSHQTPGVRCGLQTTQAVYEIIGTSTTNLQDYVLDAPNTGEKKLSAFGDEMVMSVRWGRGNVVMVDQVRQVGASDLLSLLHSQQVSPPVPPEAVEILRTDIAADVPGRSRMRLTEASIVIRRDGTVVNMPVCAYHAAAQSVASVEPPGHLVVFGGSVAPPRHWHVESLGHEMTHWI